MFKIQKVRVSKSFYSTELLFFRCLDSPCESWSALVVPRCHWLSLPLSFSFHSSTTTMCIWYTLNLNQMNMKYHCHNWVTLHVLIHILHNLCRIIKINETLFFDIINIRINYIIAYILPSGCCGMLLTYRISNTSKSEFMVYFGKRTHPILSFDQHQ